MASIWAAFCGQGTPATPPAPATKPASAIGPKKRVYFGSHGRIARCTIFCIYFRSSLPKPHAACALTLCSGVHHQLPTFSGRTFAAPRVAAINLQRIASMALDAPLAALERHCGLARGHGRFFLNAGAFIGLMVLSNALEEELYTNLPGFDYFKAVACLELATFASAALYAERRSGLKRHARHRSRSTRYWARRWRSRRPWASSRTSTSTLPSRRSSSARRRLPTMALMVLCGKRVYAGERRGGADDGAVGVLLRRRRAPGRRGLQLPGRAAEWAVSFFRRCRSRCRTARCGPCVEIKSVSGAPDNSSPRRFSASTRPGWPPNFLGVLLNQHRQAIDQMARMNAP